MVVRDRQPIIFKQGESNLSKHPKEEKKSHIKTYLLLGFGLGCTGVGLFHRKRGWIA